MLRLRVRRVAGFIVAPSVKGVMRWSVSAFISVKL